MRSWERSRVIVRTGVAFFVIWFAATIAVRVLVLGLAVPRCCRRSSTTVGNNGVSVASEVNHSTDRSLELFPTG
jgi:hypothetical protein